MNWEVQRTQALSYLFWVKLQQDGPSEFLELELNFAPFPGGVKGHWCWSGHTTVSRRCSSLQKLQAFISGATESDWIKSERIQSYCDPVHYKLALSLKPKSRRTLKAKVLKWLWQRFRAENQHAGFLRDYESIWRFHVKTLYMSPSLSRITHLKAWVAITCAFGLHKLTFSSGGSTCVVLFWHFTSFSTILALIDLIWFEQPRFPVALWFPILLDLNVGVHLRLTWLVRLKPLKLWCSCAVGVVNLDMMMPVPKLWCTPNKTIFTRGLSPCPNGTNHLSINFHSSRFIKEVQTSLPWSVQCWKSKMINSVLTNRGRTWTWYVTGVTSVLMGSCCQWYHSVVIG